MYATCRTLLQRSLDDSKSSRKITNLIFPRGSVLYIITVRWSLLDHQLTISQMMSIGWSNRRIQDSSIIESHLWLSQRITVVFIMCTNSSLKSFSNQTASQKAILAAIVFCLGGAQSHRLLLPAHPGYRRKSQGETTPKSALTVHHTACPISISISK